MVNKKSIALAVALVLSGIYVCLWLYALFHMKEEHKRNKSWTLPGITTWWAFNEKLFEERCRSACHIGKVTMFLAASAYIYWATL